MSPVGGVGINLALQDAVATANLLAEPLRSGPVGVELLRGVQRRRGVTGNQSPENFCFGCATSRSCQALSSALYVESAARCVP